MDSEGEAIAEAGGKIPAAQEHRQTEKKQKAARPKIIFEIAR
jgi:hypothetical protein